jgi:hypothetical protein
VSTSSLPHSMEKPGSRVLGHEAARNTEEGWSHTHILAWALGPGQKTHCP